MLFGTFHMPEHELPVHYGVDEPGYPQRFLGQLVQPFRDLVESAQRDQVTSRPPTP
jgi:hypothetical protein